jgi:hypothetical protein
VGILARTLGEWLGDTASWEQAKDVEKKEDKRVKCYVCDFIKALREED